MRTNSFHLDLDREHHLICQTLRDYSEFSGSPNISEVRAAAFDETKKPIAFFKGFVLHLIDLAEADGDLFLECDGHSQTVSDLYAHLLMEEKPLSDAKSGWDGDLFHL